MELATLTSKGQLTIPVSIRNRLDLAVGDRLLFYEKNGKIVIDKESPSALGDAQIAAAENHIYSLREICQIVEPIAKKHRIGSVRLFGSYARNAATAQSDLDFIIDRGEVRSLFELGGFQAELADAFRKRIDLITEDSADIELLNEISRDEVMIYDGRQA